MTVKSTKPSKFLKPPVALDGCRVEQFAVRPGSVRFAGQGLLFRDGKEVGPMPRLAIGRDRSGELFLLFCDSRWNAHGAIGGYSTIREVKQRAERFYPGISPFWRKTGYTAAQFRRAMGPELRCAICRKPWYDVEQMVVNRRAKLHICGGCVAELHARIQSQE